METLDPRKYTVAWIAPLTIEARAALMMLDNQHHGGFPMRPGDDFIFLAGDINGHNVIIATFYTDTMYGDVGASHLSDQVRRTFRNLEFGLLVGIAAGIPDLLRSPSRDIRMGDVLVSLPEGRNAGIIAYSQGAETDKGFELMGGADALPRTHPIVVKAIKEMKSMGPGVTHRFLPFYERVRYQRQDGGNPDGGNFDDPGQHRDFFYGSDNRGAPQLIQRKPRADSDRTRVWYGPIGSGSIKMKSARRRDELRNRYGIIGLEMEAAGTMYNIPVGVIRGVCDYGDCHKDKAWQPYAAAMAASYAKAILYQIPPQRV